MAAITHDGGEDDTVTNKQKAALVLTGAAALMLLFSTLTRTWFRLELGRANSFSMGLLSAESCGGGRCEQKPLSDVIRDEETGATFVFVGKLTFGLGLLSSALLLAVGLLGFKRHPRASQIGKIALMVLIATVAGAMYLLIKRPPWLGASLGVFLFMAGGMAGVIGAQMLSNPATYEEVERDPSIPRL